MREQEPVEEQPRSSGFLGALGRLMPRGGLRHPDSLVKNRELYIGSRGTGPPLLPGLRPRVGKSLLVGDPRKLRRLPTGRIPLLARKRLRRRSRP